MCFNRIKLNNQFVVIYANEQSDSASKKKDQQTVDPFLEVRI